MNIYINQHDYEREQLFNLKVAYRSIVHTQYNLSIATDNDQKEALREMLQQYQNEFYEAFTKAIKPLPSYYEKWLLYLIEDGKQYLLRLKELDRKPSFHYKYV